MYNNLFIYILFVGDNGSTHALYLETIVEETSDDLRSERSSAATWLSDSDADSVIQVRGHGGESPRRRSLFVNQRHLSFDC